jgi:phospholipase D1/2
MPSRSTARAIVFVLLLLAAGGVAYWLFGTEHGQRWTERDYAREQVEAHPVIAPLAFVAAYVVLGVLLVPLWWMQLLAGVCFGIPYGTLLCVAGHVAGATGTVWLSEWLTGDWLRRILGRRLEKVEALRRRIGRNPLLLVAAARLVHGVPFGASNYAFGLLEFRLRDVALGTLIGCPATIAMYVTVGALGLDLTKEWRLLVAVLAVNLCILAPVWWYARRRTRTANDEG